MDVPGTITISRNGQQYGPYTIEQATSYLQAGTLLPTDLAWNAQTNAWIPLSQMPGIRFVAPPPPPVAPTQGRNVFVLILMGIVWFFIIFFVPLILLGMVAGIVAGGMHPDEATNAGRQAGQTIGSIMGLPLMVIAIGLSIWLTIIGKLPGTRK